MVEAVERTKRKFYYLDEATFDVSEVNAFSCEGYPERWSIPGNGIGVIGYQIFDTMASLRARAGELLHLKEVALADITQKYIAM